MAQRDLNDVGHWFGADLQLSPTGDLARVAREDRSRQRVLRRLMTPDGDYMTHPGYGAGLPARIGAMLDIAEARGIITAEMAREASVEQSAGLRIVVRPIPNGGAAHISYMTAPERAPAVLSFSFDEVE